MRIWQKIIPVLVGFALVMSGGITGYGNALAAGGTMLTICSDAGARDIMIGTNGEEVPLSHSCVDCCLAVPMLAGSSPLPELPVTLGAARCSPSGPLRTPALFSGCELARGPPVVV